MTASDLLHIYKQGISHEDPRVVADVTCIIEMAKYGMDVLGNIARNEYGCADQGCESGDIAGEALDELERLATRRTTR